jgi:outer membrane protein assembly factor BamB
MNWQRWPIELASVLLSTAALAAGIRGETPEPVKGAAGQWHQWRGPTGQGYSDDKRVPLTWSNTENLLWKRELPGGGNSTPIVWGDRVFLTAAGKDGKERYVVCIRASDGQELWKKLASKGMAPGQTHNWNGYASASCTTDGKHVYAFFGTPGLFCYDMNGKKVWKHEFGIFPSVWGTAASPFLFEDLVIQNCDNDGPDALPSGSKPGEAAPMALVAFDKTTGKERWRTPRNQGRGFSTPRLIPSAKGRLDLVLNGPLGVWAYDPRTGKERWHCNRTAPGEQGRFGEPIPASNGDMLFGLSGRHGPLQAIRMGGDGDVTDTHIAWQIKRNARDVASPILMDNLLYVADRDATLTVFDAKTGKIVYDKQRLGAGKKNLMSSPVVLRGKILYLLDDGTTVVMEPGRKFKALHRNQLGDGKTLDFGASPAIANGRLFLRSQTHLYCIGEKK